MKEEIFYSYTHSKTKQECEYQIVKNNGVIDKEGKRIPVPPSAVQIDSAFKRLLFSKDMRYETEALLDFHFSEYKGKPNIFLRHTEQILSDVNDKTHPILKYSLDWLKKKNEENNQDETVSENISPAKTLNKIAHKLVLLWELGIIQLLEKENKDLPPIEIARLVGTIINEKDKAQIETIKKTLIYIGKKNPRSPINPTSIKKVKSILADYGIETKKI